MARKPEYLVEKMLESLFKLNIISFTKHNDNILSDIYVYYCIYPKCPNKPLIKKLLLIFNLDYREHYNGEKYYIFVKKLL